MTACASEKPTLQVMISEPLIKGGSARCLKGIFSYSPVLFCYMPYRWHWLVIFSILIHFYCRPTVVSCAS